MNYVEGANFTSVTSLAEVVTEAKNVDVVVLCIGEEAYAETPGNIDNLMLSDSQITLARAIFNIGKPVVVIYVGGRPRIITEIVEKADSVIVTFLPGTRGGEAIADILFGNYNPSAKFPITYPRGPNGAMTYDYRPLEDFDYNFGANIPYRFDAVFSFGHGLSYTEFTYSNLVINTTNVKPPNGIAGSVNVKNIGNRSGAETVIVYLNDEYSHISRPVKQMKAFHKVELQPNEIKKVDFELTLKDMSFIDMDSKRVYEKGWFNIYVGNLTEKFYLECSTNICQY